MGHSLDKSARTRPPEIFISSVYSQVIKGENLLQLMLFSSCQANTYNVKIECEGKLEQGMDKMVLELLSTKRIYEELADYKAPSAS